jgi:hypothetical protein
VSLSQYHFSLRTLDFPFLTFFLLHVTNTMIESPYFAVFILLKFSASNPIPISIAKVAAISLSLEVSAFPSHSSHNPSLKVPYARNVALGMRSNWYEKDTNPFKGYFDKLVDEKVTKRWYVDFPIEPIENMTLQQQLGMKYCRLISRYSGDRIYVDFAVKG